VREFDYMYGLSDSTAHFSAIESMDINADMVADLDAGLESVDSISKLRSVLGEGKVPVFRCLEFMDSQETDESWGITSDSISGLLAEELEADRLVIATDVDGILSGDDLIERVDIENASEYAGSCIDESLPEVLDRSEIPCAIVSGKEPERIERAVKLREFKGTMIS